MRRLLAALVLVVGLSAACICAADTSGNSDPEIEITAAGQAVILDRNLVKAIGEATDEAKRNAVEIATRIFVSSDAVLGNRELEGLSSLKDYESFISTWQVVASYPKTQKIERDTLATMKIRVKVKLLSLVTALLGIQDICEQMERPRVVVVFTEEIEGEPVTSEAGSSAVPVMRALSDFKLDVVAGLIGKLSVRTGLSGDVKVATALAQDQGAELLLLGRATAGKEELSKELGEEFQSASAQLTASLIYTATGDVVFTYRQAEGKGVSANGFREAASKALHSTGKCLLDGDEKGFAARILAEWGKQIHRGRVFRVATEGLKHQDIQALRDALGKFEGHVSFLANNVDPDQGSVCVRTRLNGKKFRYKLSRVRIAGRQIIVRSKTGNLTRAALK